MADGPEKCRADLLHFSGRGIEATGYEAAASCVLGASGSEYGEGASAGEDVF